MGNRTMPSHKVELHIFTNSTRHAPKTDLIDATYASFVETFGAPTMTTVWHDPKPNKRASNEYHKNLKKNFPEVYITSSLSDGYTRALTESKADYLFMLEHDWVFDTALIDHGLKHICDAMKTEGLVHFRFNRTRNSEGLGDQWLIEKTVNGLAYCLTPYLSNNPHIIQREKYADEILPHIMVSKHGKKYGIEEEVSKVEHLHGAVYGPKDYPPTIGHLDGSGVTGVYSILSKLKTGAHLFQWAALKKLKSIRGRLGI